MAELAGNLNEVWVLTGTTPMTGSTGAKVMGVDNATYKKLCDILETSQAGDVYKKRMPGLKDTEISFSGKLYSDDATGQDVLEPGDYAYVGIYPQGPTAAGVQVQTIVESFSTAAAQNGIQTFEAGVACSGAPVALPARS